MTTENGNGNMYMPVAPAFGYGNGYGCNDGLGNNGWWVLLLLWAMGGNNGFFGNGFGNGVEMPYFYNTQTQNALSNQIEGVQNSVDQVRTQNQLSSIQDSINSGFANTEVAACNRAMNQMQTQYQTAIDNMNRQFNLATATDDRLDNLAMSLQKCCCDNQLATAQTQNLLNQTAAATQYQAAQNTRDIITNATANTQAVLDKLCQLELDGVRSQVADRDREISALQNQLSLANLAASQTAQTGQLMADNAAQTQYIVNRVAPYPTPSYIVSNPYGYNGNFGCGCGCNGGIA